MMELTGRRPLPRAMIEPDQFDEKLAGGGSGPTICWVAPLVSVSFGSYLVPMHREKHMNCVTVTKVQLHGVRGTIGNWRRRLIIQRCDLTEPRRHTPINNRFC